MVGRAVVGRVVVGVLAGGVALTLVACGGGSSTAAGTSAVDGKLIPVTTEARHGGLSKSRTRVPSTTTTAPEATTTTTTLPVIAGVDPTLEQTVWDAYLTALQAMDESDAIPDPNLPAVTEHLTNSMLRTWQAAVTQFAEDGEAGHYPPGSTHGSRLYGMVVRYPTWVDIDACTFDDTVLAVKSTGVVVNDDASYLRSTETMWLEDGTWRLAGRDGTKVDKAQCPGF
jgi:hypothetical protein